MEIKKVKFSEKILYDKKIKIRADINVKLIDMNKNIELTTESITYLNKDQKILQMVPQKLKFFKI